MSEPRVSRTTPPGENWREKKDNWLRAVMKTSLGKNSYKVAVAIFLDTWVDDPPEGCTPGTYTRGSERLFAESGIAGKPKDHRQRVSDAIRPLDKAGLLDTDGSYVVGARSKCWALTVPENSVQSEEPSVLENQVQTVLEKDVPPVLENQVQTVLENAVTIPFSPPSSSPSNPLAAAGHEGEENPYGLTGTRFETWKIEKIPRPSEDHDWVPGYGWMEPYE